MSSSDIEPQQKEISGDRAPDFQSRDSSFKYGPDMGLSSIRENQTPEDFESFDRDGEGAKVFGAKPQKSGLRLQYEAETQVIQAKLGNLEEMRNSLGLSRRKMCRLLMVDPSAWSRWTNKPESVPPSVYRSLQWYFALIDKKPEWHPQNSYLEAHLKDQQKDWENMRSRVLKRVHELGNVETSLKNDVEALLSRTNDEIHGFKAELEKKQGVQVLWKLLLIINFFAVLILIFKSL